MVYYRIGIFTFRRYRLMETPLMEENLEQSSPYLIPNLNFESKKDGKLNVSEKSSQLNIVVSGLYTVVAMLMIIQGFGISIAGRWTSFFLGLYTMAFGVIAIMYDLRMEVMEISIEQYFPFLGNYFGRASAIFFFALLAEQSRYMKEWNYFITILDLVVAVFYMYLHVTLEYHKTDSTEGDSFQDSAQELDEQDGEEDPLAFTNI